MKCNGKKSFALALCLALLIPFGGLCAGAEDPLPESEHDYANDLDQRWDYTWPGEARGLFVTFSEDTWVEELGGWIIIDDIVENGAVTVGSMGKNIIFPTHKTGDVIVIYGENDKYIGSYRGDALAGKTIFIPGRSFAIELITDGSVTGYGFKVTKVEPCPDDYIREITFLPGGDAASFTELYTAEDTVYFDDWYYRRDGFAFAGWSDTENGAVLFDTEDEATAGDVPQTLYGVWVPLALGREEVFSFHNSSWYFDVDDQDHYYMTAEDYYTMQANLFKNFGLGPYPTPVVSVVLATFRDWEFAGSCYGMSVVTALQHYGYLDVLSMQNAACMNDMEPDEALISLINYYQTQTATSFPAENKALVKGSPNMRQQFRDLYRTVSEGNIVMLTYFREGIERLNQGHVILLTGCYTTANGDMAFIVYDCNSSDYEYGWYDETFRVPAGSSTAVYDGENIDAFFWTDDFSRFTSFDINGKTTPFAWYISYFRHIIETLTAFIRMIGNVGK
ncbi:MAG: hypothetical protein IJK98_09665 [Clostridia bacterium]|nr:hypothetical protein [Clostridia bacterium]